jgi:hypothetical protein
MYQLAHGSDQQITHRRTSDWSTFYLRPLIRLSCSKAIRDVGGWSRDGANGQLGSLGTNGDVDQQVADLFVNHTVDDEHWDVHVANYPIILGGLVQLQEESTFAGLKA